MRPRRALLFGPLGPASWHDRTSAEQTASKTLRPRMGRLRSTRISQARRKLGSFYARWHPGCKDCRFVSSFAESYSVFPTQPAYPSPRITKDNANNKGSPYSRHNTRDSVVHATMYVRRIERWFSPAGFSTSRRLRLMLLQAII